MIFGESGDFLVGWGEVGIAGGAGIRAIDSVTSDYRTVVYFIAKTV